MEENWRPVLEHVEPHPLCCDDCKHLRAALREIADLDDPHHRGHTRFIRAVAIAQAALGAGEASR